jgi:integrase
MVVLASVREKHGQKDHDYMTKLTPPSLRTLLKKPGRHSDGQGLFFRVLGDAKAYWVYRFRINGREREMSLSPYPELGLGEARRKHAELRAQVLNGIDPLAYKHGAKSTVSSGVATFGEIANDYVETHEGAWRSAKHRRHWRMTLTEYCKPIWSKPVDQIATADVLACLKPLWTRTPETALRLRGRIETVIDAARALGHVPEDKANPARWKGHLDHLLPKRNKLDQAHHKALSYADVAELEKRLRAVDSMTALALEFVILTATRTGETLGAQWREFDREAATWSIPASRMKMGREHCVPLSDRAIEILAEARRRARKEPEPDSFVFFGMRPKKPLSPMAMTMLLRRMNIDATVHGMRSAARSWMADQAIPFELAEACLAHQVGNAVVQAYQRSSMLERRRPIMSAWADFVTGKTADNVVPLRAAQ